jgi:hypothetical protein
LITAVLATAGIALAVALAATNANADPPSGTRPHAGEDEAIKVAGGYLKFSHHGEILEVKDTRLDGHGLRGFIVDIDEEDHPVSVADRITDDEPEYLNRSFPEGDEVHLKLCYTTDGECVEWSRWQTAFA